MLEHAFPTELKKIMSNQVGYSEYEELSNIKAKGGVSSRLTSSTIAGTSTVPRSYSDVIPEDMRGQLPGAIPEEDLEYGRKCASNLLSNSTNKQTGTH